jgi:signal transduction histidine kinase
MTETDQPDTLRHQQTHWWQTATVALRAFWHRLDLAGQFLAMGAVVLVLGMLAIGLWVTSRIEDGVIGNSAAATALYVDSVISPLFETFSKNGRLTEGAARALDETLAQGELGKRLEVFKIWLRDGTVSYASDPALIGQKFAVTDQLRRAWAGQVAAEFNHLGDDENAAERAVVIPLLEIYSPIREPWSGEVIAVAEFYEHAEELETSLVAARLQSWLTVGCVTSAMLAMLYGIVRRGSRTIVEQRRALEDRVGELSRLLQQNRALRRSVLAASDRSVALNEQYLRRISADLHDGPAQLLALAAMRLGSPTHAGNADGTPSPELDQVRSFLADALKEIRSICRGLALPQIEAMTLADLLRAVVATHEERTGNRVALVVPDADVALDDSARICLYRFVQEALNNANRHAGGTALEVAASVDGEGFAVTVRDGGLGFDPVGRSPGLGLQGMRERIASLGGSLSISSSAAGTELRCTIPAHPAGAARP